MKVMTVLLHLHVMILNCYFHYTFPLAQHMSIFQVKCLSFSGITFHGQALLPYYSAHFLHIPKNKTTMEMAPTQSPKIQVILCVTLGFGHGVNETLRSFGILCCKD